jgi:hypothetical protein
VEAFAVLSTETALDFQSWKWKCNKLKVSYTYQGTMSNVAQFIGYTCGTIAVSFIAAYASMYCMDWCTRPAERRRAIERAVAQESCQEVRERTMEILFPPNRVRD